MSDIDYMEKLLQGVEVKWKTLEEVANFSNGKGHEKNIVEDGKYIVVNSKFISTDGEVVKYSDQQICPLFTDDILIVMSDLPNGKALAKTFLVNKNDVYTLNQRIGRISVKDNKKLLPKFLNSYLNRTPQLKKYDDRKSQTNLRKDQILKVKIPILPIDVQIEIIRIIDKLTQLKSELISVLTVELSARKKQYNYYCDQLLTFMEGKAEWKTLGEVSLKISSGGTPKTGVLEYWKNGKIPWMSSGEVNLETVYKTEKYITEAGLNNSSAKMVPSDSIVIALAGQGKTRGKVARIRIDLTTNQSLASLTFDKKQISYDYVFHFLKTQYENLRLISSGSGNRGGLNLQMISKYKLPVPPIAEQKRIVAILDKFDALTNSLTEVIQQEIELRQQQYEYYREILLSFPKAEVADHD